MLYMGCQEPRSETPTESAADAPEETVAVAAAIGDTLCVCVLDHNLPLSAKAPDSLTGMQGLYVELADQLARSMDKKLKLYTDMSVYYKRPVRQGLLANHCDMQMGLPRSEDDWYIPRKVVLTQAFLEVGYVVVTHPDRRITKLEDLRGMSVVAQIGAPPIEALAQYDDINLSFHAYPEQAMAALDAGEADAAFIWGPSAGYLNKHEYKSKYQVVATDYRWPVAIGLRAADMKLRDRVNEMLGQMTANVAQLEQRYGMPGNRVVAMRPKAD